MFSAANYFKYIQSGSGPRVVTQKIKQTCWRLEVYKWSVWLDSQKKLDLDILNELEELFSKVEETAERLHYLNTDLEMQERNWKSVYNLKIHKKC